MATQLKTINSEREIDIRLQAFNQALQSPAKYRIDLPLAKFETRWVVGLDLDGVFYDFAGSLRTFINKSTGRPIHTMPAPTQWNFWEDWNMSVDEWLDYCHKGVNAGVVFGIDGYIAHSFDSQHSIHMVKSFQSLFGNHVDFVIVTDRHFGDKGLARNATRNWLYSVGLPNEVHFSADKTIVKTDFFIDDKPENCEALAKAGTDVVMVTRPWNKDYAFPKRIDNVTNFLLYVMEKMFQQCVPFGGISVTHTADENIFDYKFEV
jgi:hypothetical protein